MSGSNCIRDLCVALFHRWEPERTFVIFSAYLDESGTHGSSPVTVMAGFMGTAREWQIVERRLRALQDELWFSIFHATDFRTGSGAFRGWSDDKRMRLVWICDLGGQQSYRWRVDPIGQRPLQE